MPKLLLHSILPFLLLCFRSAPQSYEQAFAADYASALRFVKVNLPFIRKSALVKKNDPALLASTVFPELLRYSFFKDVLETGALELMYTEHGSTVADFSIGAFQMKPSFAEDLENTIAKNDSLAKIYSALKAFSTTTEKGKRQERLKRLRSLHWQLQYANCFLSVMELKYKDKTFASPNDKIKFFACAYNSGFHRKEKDIEARITVRQFPYGKNYTGEQYAYSDVAGDFYSKHSTRLFTPKN